MDKRQSPNWINLFKDICKRGESALKWGLPEYWIQTELFVDLDKSSEWTTLQYETPYVTYWPVKTPPSRNVKEQGSLKYIDLSFYSKETQEWWWFELKVRHASEDIKRNQQFLHDYKKDVVALLGFDLEKTVHEIKTQTYIKAYWIDEFILPNIKVLENYKHRFATAILLLNDSLDNTIWNEAHVNQQIDNWLKTRNKQVGLDVWPEYKADFYSKFDNVNSLVITEW